MSFGQVRIELEGATAVEFGAFEPFTGGIEFEMAGGADERESGMREGKCGVAGDRVAEVLRSFFECGWITGGAETVAAHEFGVGHGVPAVARAALRGEGSYRPIQSEGDLPGDVVFEIGDAIGVEIMFPGKHFALRVRVQQFEGEPPLAFGHLQPAMEDKADPRRVAVSEGGAEAGKFITAEMGRTSTPGRLPRRVIKASAKPRQMP